jgi:hypothetical protein
VQRKKSSSTRVSLFDYLRDASKLTCALTSAWTEEDVEEDDDAEEDEFVNALLDELSTLRTAVRFLLVRLLLLAR